MKRLLTLILVVNLIVLDLTVGFMFYRFIVGRSDANVSGALPSNANFESDSCSSECQEKIYQEIEALKKVKVVGDNLLTVTPTMVQIASKQIVPAKIKSVSYVPIPGNGNVLNTDWTDIPGTDFYLSKSDYVGLVGIYLEANLKLQNGNGTANLRLYDKTHSIAPNGGEVSTSSQSSTFVTHGPVYLWEGNNHYVLQARSSTSDTTIFESGRLKIITEN